MNEWAAQEVSSRITLPNVLEKYYRIGPRGRIPCPFHDGRDNNFCYTQKVYHCWVCGAKGNLFTFVMNFFGLDFCSALEKLNFDFSLKINTRTRLSVRQMQDAKKRCQAAKNAAKKRVEYQRDKAALEAALMDTYSALDADRRLFAPRSPSEAFHPRYVQALIRLPYIEYLIDCFT